MVGLKTTLMHLIRYRPITIQYPHEKRILPENYRGMLCLLRYEDGTEKSVGCGGGFRTAFNPLAHHDRRRISHDRWDRVLSSAVTLGRRESWRCSHRGRRPGWQPT